METGGNTSTIARTDGDSSANKSASADHSLTTDFEYARVLRGRRSEKPGAIYFVSYGVGGPIKIGFVNGFASLFERLRGLQTGCPHDLILLAVRPGTISDERDLHERFNRKRLRGEWFEPHKELLSHIRGVRRRKDCQKELALHPQYQPAPEGMKFLYHSGSRTWLVTA